MDCCYRSDERPQIKQLKNRLGNQIIIGVADDFDLGEFSHRQFPTHINASVNVRRIRLAARDEVNALHLRRVPVGFADEAVFP